ncbi:MAG: hypothetical protein ACRD2A_00665 [Vicinamibacterales bacterium]
MEVTVAELGTLPLRVDRIEKTLTDFRDEVRQEFAAVRSEIGDVRSEVKAAIVASEEATHRQLRVVHEDLVQRIGASEDETRRQMRMLHEDLFQRIKTMGEGG